MGYRISLMICLLFSYQGLAFAQEEPKKGRAQESKKVLLRWAKPFKSPLAFQTKLIPIQAKELGLLLKQDMKDLIKASIAPISSFSKDRPRWLEMIAAPYEKEQLIQSFTLVKQSKTHKGLLDVQISNLIDQGLARPMLTKTSIRTTVNERGESQSFYLPQKERNVLSLFFKLPENAVKVGDHWSIPFHFVSLPGMFQCKKAIQKNRVVLSAIETSKAGEKVAVLDYRILEHVEGSLPSSPDHGHDHKVAITMVFFASGRFDIKRGSWIQLRGRLRLRQSGEWSSDYEQIYSFIPCNKVPAHLRKKP